MTNFDSPGWGLATLRALHYAATGQEQEQQARKTDIAKIAGAEWAELWIAAKLMILPARPREGDLFALTLERSVEDHVLLVRAVQFLVDEWRTQAAGTCPEGLDEHIRRVADLLPVPFLDEMDRQQAEPEAGEKEGAQN